MSFALVYRVKVRFQPGNGRAKRFERLGAICIPGIAPKSTAATVCNEERKEQGSN